MTTHLSLTASRAVTEAFRSAVMLFAALVMISAPGMSHALPAGVREQVALLLQAGKPAEALDLLRRRGGRDEANFDLLSLSGTCEIELGRPAAGIDLLLRANKLRPSDGATRAELARGYLALGDIANARRALDTVDVRTVPADAQSALALLRARIETASAVMITEAQGERALDRAPQPSLNADPPAKTLAPSVPVVAAHRLTGQISITGGYDDNANIATLRERILFPGLSNEAIDSQPRVSSWYAEIGGHAIHLAPLSERWSWQTTGFGSYRRVASAHRFDFSYVDLRSGPILHLSRNWSLLTEAALLGLWSGNRLDRRVAGVHASLRRTADDAAAVRLHGGSIYAQGSTNRVERRPDLDSRRLLVGLTAYGRGVLSTPAQNGRATWDMNTYFVRDDVTDGPATPVQETFRGVGARVGMRVPVAPGVRLGATAGFERRRYAADDPLLMTRRRDNQRDATLFAELDLWGDQWVLVPSVHLWRNVSSLPTHDSRRLQGSVTLRAAY